MDLAVKLRNVNFSYDKGDNAQKILDSVNITVPCGVIYGLLGPSGCGKTTLLKVMTGRFRLKCQSEVLIFGQIPASEFSTVPGPGIGYMPQELALYETLTIKETLYLFGKLNLVKQSILKQRIEKLCAVLELPLKKKLIENLSGGQQRRVSLATALVHDPPLLILDEPTVGVDPLLRKQIWSYLVNLTSTRNTTIIITTHYIDEAKDASIIGAMRKGRMLVEASPTSIMNAFQDFSLESCFAKLCYMDSDITKSRELKVIAEESRISAAAVASLSNENNENIENTRSRGSRGMNYKMPKVPHYLYRAQILTKRNFIQRRRHMPSLLFQVAIPIVTIVLYCLCIGTDLFDVPVSFVNDEGPNGYAQDFFDRIDKNVISYTTHHNFEDARQSVLSGLDYAVLHIEKNFTRCFRKRLHDDLDVSNETVLCGSVSAHFDQTNQQVFYVLYRSFMKTFKSFFENVLNSMNKTSYLARLPVDFSEPIFGKEDEITAEYMIPGIILVISHFMSAAATIVKMIEERANGLEEKLYVTATTRIDLLISHIATEFILTTIQAILLLIVVFYIFNINLQGSIVLLALITIAQGLVGMTFGFMISSLVDNSSYAIILNVGVMFCCLFTCGILWPVEGMPAWLRPASKFVPLALPNEAFKAIMSRGLGLTHLTVILGYVSSLAWLIIYFILTVLGLKFLN